MEEEMSNERTINEDEVVISRAEYEKLKSFVHKEDVHKIMKEELYKTVKDITKELWKKVRKETAKEIIQWVSKMQKACYTDEAIIGHLIAHYGVGVEQ